ncbi:M20 peptidase aminoacylase family protein [Fictibacillus nanhaiensis]|uniref:M20 peptidase aminoacylase family protein n=1 Tax=Fictibacillus nanhaiensis TaxID=742169 RepID=UPI00203DA861|nr:M20 peptidase aminoacylase family protein [Fictibacillus nanhaiensis]MCM3731638.1 M20 peptidase aminoacylase family protein [Fictibacillus nanhaiensis]
MKAIKRWTNHNSQLIFDIFTHFNTNPEVSWKEEKTKEFILQEAQNLDFDVETFEDHCGVVLNWYGEENGSTIALRADMDALWQNVDGKWKANHSCGHDAHMTMALAAAHCLKQLGFKPLAGNVKFIFQPAEETGKGALALIQNKVLENVDYLLGIHVRPKIEMEMSHASPAIYHGAATLLQGTIKGIQAHGSRPNYGINVIDSLGSIIAAVNAVKVDPTVPSSVKVTQVHAGGSNINVIPDEATFCIDVRSQTNQSMEELLRKVNAAVLYAGKANGAEVNLDISAQMAAANQNSEMEAIISSVITDILGPEALVPPPVTPGGEDFHFYTTEYPKLKATMIGLGTDLEPGLHHPNMTFDHDALLNGTALLAYSIIKLFEHTGNKAVYDHYHFDRI